MSDDVNKFLKGSSGDLHPAFKFEKVGDTIAGRISETPKILNLPNMNTGTPEDKLVIAVTRDDGNTFAVWVKAGVLARAIFEACQAVGVDGVAEGGLIAIQFSGERNTGKPQPLKEFKAEYQPPAPVTVGGSLLAGAAGAPQGEPVAAGTSSVL